MRRTATFALTLALVLVLGLQPARAADSAAEQLSAIRARLLGLINDLGNRDYLTQTQIEDLRDELADIYGDLHTVELSIGGTVVDQPQPPANSWAEYKLASVQVLPASASFKGWKSGNSIDIRFGGNSDIYVTVTNGSYTAETHLPNAYKGTVKTNATADQSGFVLLDVKDDRGSHSYRIDNGGIGPVYVRGGSSGDKSTSPVPPGGGDSTSIIPDGKWDGLYRDMLAGGQISASPSFEWFAAQVKKRQYVSDGLRDLGEYVRQMEGEYAHDQIAALRFYSSGKEKQMALPDPRVEVLDFINALNKIYALDSAGDWYMIELE